VDGTGIAIAVALGVGGLVIASVGVVVAVRLSIRAELSSVRSDLTEVIETLRSDVTSLLSALRSDVTSMIDKRSGELRHDISDLRAFSGGGKWEAMHAEMAGMYEIRVQGGGKNHRLFCVLDRGADGWAEHRLPRRTLEAAASGSRRS
jgi:hypothetical protein